MLSDDFVLLESVGDRPCLDTRLEAVRRGTLGVFHRWGLRKVLAIAAALAVVSVSLTAWSLARPEVDGRDTEFTDIRVLNSALNHSGLYEAGTQADLGRSASGITTVVVTLWGVDTSSPTVTVVPDAIESAARLVWTTLPGRFDNLRIHVLSKIGTEIRPSRYSYSQLQKKFGDRSSYLTSADSLAAGPGPSETSPGNCNNHTAPTATTQLFVCNTASSRSQPAALLPGVRKVCAGSTPTETPDFSGVVLEKPANTPATEKVEWIWYQANLPSRLSVEVPGSGEDYATVRCAGNPVGLTQQGFQDLTSSPDQPTRVIPTKAPAAAASDVEAITGGCVSYVVLAQSTASMVATKVDVPNGSDISPAEMVNRWWTDYPAIATGIIGLQNSWTARVLPLVDDGTANHTRDDVAATVLQFRPQVEADCRSMASQIVAGTESEPDDPAPSTPEPTTSALTSDDRSTIGFDHWGLVKLGMTPSRAARMLDAKVADHGESGTDGCFQPQLTRPSGDMTFMVEGVTWDGPITRFSIDNPSSRSVHAGGPRTEEGVGIGSTEAQVKAAYPHRVKITAQLNEAPGAHNLEVLAGAGDPHGTAIVFETDATERVTGMRWGYRKQVAYTEGCS